VVFYGLGIHFLFSLTREIIYTNYDGSAGTWFIRDPVSKTASDSAFTVNRGTRIAQFTDGLSGTLGVAEVKTQTDLLARPCMRRIPLAARSLSATRGST
jgi:hypothetical protein